MLNAILRINALLLRLVIIWRLILRENILVKLRNAVLLVQPAVSMIRAIAARPITNSKEPHAFTIRI